MNFTLASNERSYSNLKASCRERRRRLIDGSDR
jgi:hypothetical protein